MKDVIGVTKENKDKRNLLKQCKKVPHAKFASFGTGEKAII